MPHRRKDASSVAQACGAAGTMRAHWLQPLTGERGETEVELAPRLSLRAPFDGPYVVRLRPA